jgi:hypothetical protein
LLTVGIGLSLLDFLVSYAAAARDGALRINQGIGLINHYGFVATVVGNAVALYAAKKYYESACAIKTSDAVRNPAPIDRSLRKLVSILHFHGGYRFLMFFLIIFGALNWVGNIKAHLVGEALSKWGLVFDSMVYPWSFFVGRIHLFY